MTQNFEKELQRFDKDRVLPAWDGLITRQQMILEKIGVPSMFVTNEKVDREVSICYHYWRLPLIIYLP